MVKNVTKHTDFGIWLMLCAILITLVGVEGDKVTGYFLMFITVCSTISIIVGMGEGN